ncbi:MAG: flotillin domain-containing protein, partial [Acidobacteriota bacterium]|nr:flotillin domain-containing protein [Acidobacteriota bacterium]
RVEINADAAAEKARREAAGEADAILARYNAEAEGTQKVLEAKAKGYQRLIDACRDDPSMAPTLLMIEALPSIIAEQVKAIQNLHIDKITVWDSGTAGDGSRSTAGFLSSLINALPPVHDLAQQAGIELPAALGRLANENGDPHRPAATEANGTDPVVSTGADDGTVAAEAAREA